MPVDGVDPALGHYSLAASVRNDLGGKPEADDAPSVRLINFIYMGLLYGTYESSAYQLANFFFF